MSAPTRRARLTAVVLGGIGVVTLLLVGCAQGSDPGGSPVPARASAESATVEPGTTTGTPSALPSAQPPPAGWVIVFEEGHAERVVLTNDVATDGTVTVAVGVVVHTSMLHIGPYTLEPRIWVSSDRGATWEPVPAEHFGNAYLSRVIAAADGFYLFGATESLDAATPSSTFSVWHSPDGRSWEPRPLGPFASPTWMMTDLAVGARGWVMVGSYSSETEPFYREEQIWHSPDGEDWEMVRAERQAVPVSGEETYRAVAAGPEGFVVIGNYAIEGGGPAVILASGDGRTWEVAPEQEAFAPHDIPFAVASLGGDWVMTGGRGEGGAYTTYVPVWWSANGLDWELSAEISDPLARPEFGLGTSLASTGDRLYLSASLSGFVEQQEAGVYTSTDARTWTAVEIDPAAGIAAALPFEDRHLLVGHIATRESRAAIWVGRLD